MKTGAIPTTVDEYIKEFPKATQTLLRQMRATIKEAAPDAIEEIAYRMPAYKLNGVLVYFAGYKGHIGFYPGAGGVAEFQKALSAFKGAKGSVQFPLDQPLPLDIVRKIVVYRANQNRLKAAAKKKPAKKAAKKQ